VGEHTEKGSMHAITCRVTGRYFERNCAKKQFAIHHESDIQVAG